MKLTIDDKEFTLDTKLAIQSGALKEVEKIAITLNKNEATVLYHILQHIGGSPTQSAREYADSLTWKIRKQIDIDELKCDRTLETSNAISIYFKDDVK